MGKVKNIIIGVVVVAVAGTGVTAGLMQVKKNSRKEVLVTSVGNLVSEYYMPSTNLDGTVTTSVAQNVSVDSDMIINEVYVAEGDTVKVGDPLISFDTTLVEMELNIAKLKRQLQEQDLHKAINRLNSLKNGGPIIEDGEGYNADNLDRDDMGSMGGDEMSSINGAVSGNYLAAAMQPLLLTAFTDADSLEEEDAVSGEETEESDDIMTGPEYQDPSAGDFTSGEDNGFTDDNDGDFASGEEDRPRPSPTPTPILDENTGYYDPYFTDGMPGVGDGEEKFHTKLEYDSEPFKGTGTKEDPYIFLVSSATGKVTVMGSFFNRMAGYSDDGTSIKNKGGFWYQLEFHQNDKIADYQDRKTSCTGYYLINGSLLTKPVYMYTETEMTLADAFRYEDELPDDPNYPGGYQPEVPSMTRKEAIKIQKNKIAGLKLDIQESDIKIGKLEKKVNRKLVSSKLDGTVAYVGDPSTGASDGGTFIKVKSGDGFYVVGAVGELMLDKIQEDSILNCMSYESGNFQAKVLEVSDYPAEGNMYSGMNNPNVSYYTFTAEVMDKTMKFRDYEYVNITLENAASSGGSLVMQKMFVRTENGQSYVYKDDNGILKKQILDVGAVVDNGYSIMINGGITRDDLVAFPYGKAVQEGAPTREVTMDEMYGY